MLNLKPEIPLLSSLKEMVASQILDKYYDSAYMVNTCSNKTEYDLKELKGLIFIRENFCFCDFEYDIETSLNQLTIDNK